MLLLGIAAVFLFIDQNAELQQLEKETAESDKLRQERNKPQETPSGQPPPQKAYVHADGTFHVGEHDDPIETPSPPEFTPASIQIPEGITDPDVVAAWKRLDYISQNIWAFGSVPSPRAEELIDELMPPPDGFKGEHGHDDLEATLDLLSELQQFRDPRAAEVFATYSGEGIVGGNAMNEALVEIGVPSVPYLIPYIDPPYDRFVKSPVAAAFALGHIGAQHREELEGVIEHIIIPKLEAFMKSDAPLMSLPQQYAYESLTMLKK